MDKTEIYNRFGKYIKEYLINRYGTIKKAGAFLCFNPSLISQYIQGEKQPSKRFEDSMKKIGFDMSYFESIKTRYDLDYLDSDGLNWEQLKFLVQELKEIIVQKNEIIQQKSSVIKILDEQVKLLNGKYR